ncbi:hypothetical protein K501DRAFT_278922 [Backusella circina FSU 941]|nr:hypothetical protein K501DRAFT_278922 [Backusella circina FSU 941]
MISQNTCKIFRLQQILEFIRQGKIAINCIFDRDNQKLNNEIKNSGKLDFNPDNIEDYEFALENPIPYFMFSSAILTKVSKNGVYCLFHRIRLGELVTTNDFTHYIYANEKECQVIWETIFNLDHVQKKRMQYEFNTSNRMNRDYNVEFNHRVRTYVHMISTLFMNNKRVGCTSPKKDDINKQKRQVDLANLTHRIYPLNRQPTDIASVERVIGINPGIRDLVTCVAPSTETNKYEKMSISNASYKYIWYMLQRIFVPSQSVITGYQHRERDKDTCILIGKSRSTLFPVL